MNISFEEITNGWLVYSPSTGEDSMCSERTAFTYNEEIDERKEKVIAAQRMLMFIVDEMGLYDKFSEFNIQVNLVEGHKFEKNI